MENKKIDIIIPAYNVEDEILFSCLSSIAIQSIKKDIKVTIVDDASTKENYETIISHFSCVLDIQLLKLSKNGGPGVARQFGLDNTNNELITFVDADDILSNGFALEELRNTLNSNKNYEIAIGNFLEVGRDLNNSLISVNYSMDFTWVFGKIYKRSFLNKYKIRFHPSSRANEDSGFNSLCKIYLQSNNTIDRIGFFDEIVYIWNTFNTSITRKNNFEYSKSVNKDASFYGFIENMIYAVNTAWDNPLSDKNIVAIFAIKNMVVIYYLFIKITAEPGNEKHLQTLVEYCSWYYKDVFSKFRKMIDEKTFIKLYNEEKANLAIKNAQTYYAKIPDLSFPDFLELIK